MRNLWHRLMVRLGFRKAPVYGRAELKVLINGKWTTVAIIKNISYSASFEVEPPSYILDSKPKTYVAGKQTFDPVTVALFSKEPPAEPAEDPSAYARNGARMCVCGHTWQHHRSYGCASRDKCGCNSAFREAK